MEPSIPPRQLLTVEGEVKVNTAWESMSVQKENGQSVVALSFNFSMAAWLPIAVNGLTVMKFSWYWMCLAEISRIPVSGVAIL